jgi:hypothetical protein
MLAAAENAAYEHQRRAAGNTSAYQSPIFPPGTEFAVALSEARLMSAIVGILNESLTEAIKSFYKMRKAYITLEGIMEAERTYVKERSTSSLESRESSSSSRPVSKKGGSSLTVNKTAASENSAAAPPKTIEPEGDGTGKEPTKAVEKTTKDAGEEDFEFVDADEEHPGVSTPQEYMGHLGAPTPDPSKNQSNPLLRTKCASSPNLVSASEQTSTSPPSSSPSPGPAPEMPPLDHAPTIKEPLPTSLYGTHPVDTFILSGANFCFGILLLLISLVPPAFATLLKVVGFKGDRERGIQMLWQATQYHNIHGAMGGLVLFGFYNSLLGFCDIVAPAGPGSYPTKRLKVLLGEMRERYPRSHLWLLEEARMLASDKNLEASVSFLKEHCQNVPLKQLDALQWFERGLNTMYMHDYADTSAAFQKCVTLNNWSHGLYYYICACSHVEAYRRALSSSPPNTAEAEAQKKEAMKMFDLVRPNLGRKKFMARQLPFDVFVARKMQKWEARASAWKTDFIDAIGVSPIEELIYFWNGYKRMSDAHLAESLQNLAWSESSANSHWSREEGVDERGILALLRGAVLRCLGRTEEARDVLRREILEVDRASFKGHLRDSWTAPCARYEMAACLWREVEVEGEGRPEGRPEVLRECGRWLQEVAAWEAYDLDAR